MNKGNIIVLNGVSSSGKSTLSKELLKSLKDYFHLSIDNYDTLIEMMEERNVENGRLIPVPTEFFFHDHLRMFSNYGINLIVDQILHNRETTNDFLEKLHDYPILFVGVHCSEEELERRERKRGDRPVGQGKSQLAFVHQQNELYDVEVNTEKESIEDCVKKILLSLETIENCLGLKRTYAKWKSEN
ncbi:AAA family ATPase [Cytobacillus sp. FJAT-54145]|uniref:AAA family ATPase n=1 Tax=Cytobacillus spartinae TaxID=3299023 RepID=A0ABW6K759_9BACI